jgi:hypothetical protein
VKARIITQLLAGILGAGIAVGVAGCAQKSMESEVLADAADSATMDARAEQYCTEYLHGLELIAAIDSTAGEVRQIATQVETRGPWHVGLPAGDEDRVSICIFDVAGVPGLKEGLRYMAYWGITSQSQNLTAW